MKKNKRKEGTIMPVVRKKKNLVGESKKVITKPVKKEELVDEEAVEEATDLEEAVEEMEEQKPARKLKRKIAPKKVEEETDDDSEDEENDSTEEEESEIEEDTEDDGDEESDDSEEENDEAVEDDEEEEIKPVKKVKTSPKKTMSKKPTKTVEKKTVKSSKSKETTSSKKVSILGKKPVADTEVEVGVGGTLTRKDFLKLSKKELEELLGDKIDGELDMKTVSLMWKAFENVLVQYVIEGFNKFKIGGKYNFNLRLIMGRFFKVPSAISGEGNGGVFVGPHLKISLTNEDMEKIPGKFKGETFIAEDGKKYTQKTLDALNEKAKESFK
jgi:hypothetical protein